jgi:hypothetical protein
MSTTPNLPYSSTFADVAGLLGSFKELGFGSWSLRVRTVAYRYKDTWNNFATYATLIDGAHRAENVTVLRDTAALIDWCEPVNQLMSTNELTNHLIRWRPALKESYGLVFQGELSLRRESSDLRRKTWPGWSAQLFVQGVSIKPMPEGPFFVAKNGVFGQDVPRLAMQFLEESRFSSALGNAPNDYILRIPDRRVRISELAVENSQLRLTVENPVPCRLHWSVVASSFANELFHQVVDIKDGRATVELPFAVQNLETWIILEDGYMLDRYEETPHRSTWGAEASLFNTPRKVQLHEIGKALTGGENEAVEFKPYIRLRPRDKKAFEILRAVSGFANMGGGDLYIGVNDEGDPVGIETEVNRDYGAEHRDLTGRETAYEKDLRKLINEGSSPNLPIDFRWHNVAHRIILQIRISQSSVPVHITETGELYRRAGSTNRKWRPSDALGAVKRSNRSLS